MTEHQAPAPDEGSEGSGPEMTLQEEFAELTPELKQAMFGKPVQQLTALLIGAILLLALLVGFTALSRNGVVGASPSPSTSLSPTAWLSGWTA